VIQQSVHGRDTTYDMAILLEENNVISLRTAYVGDDGNLVTFRLNPADYTSLIPKGRTWWAPKDFDWVEQDCTWLYRHMRSSSGEKELACGFFPVEQGVGPMSFEKPPEFKLVWTDSGHSVALYLNGEPWAFIHEKTRQGYSKGILKSTIGKLWDQELFEKTFSK
jgi:hypothetical protein